jgi:O-antigen biosynthesis protein
MTPARETRTQRRFAFVTPRFGEQILGGAETAMRELAEQLAARGDTVEVFTACITDFVSWRNELAAGTTQHHDVTVRRYPAVWGERTRFFDYEKAIYARQPLPFDAELDWLASAAHTPALYIDLKRRAREFDLIFCLPYLYPLVQYAAMIDPSKTIVWPCLHDEGYAYTTATQLLLRDARGLFFNAPAERELAREITGLAHPHAHTIGVGMTPHASDGERFRRDFGIAGPFVLYAGRLEPSKNVPLLIEMFEHYAAQRPDQPVKLVLLGDGPAKRESPHVITLGFQPEQVKHDAYRAALALCQPSLVESFSIVLMEAWLAGTPTIVNAACPVTRQFTTASNGGLFFNGPDEFGTIIDVLLARPDLRAALGAAGQAFVRREYDWVTVLQRFDAAVADWL